MAFANVPRAVLVQDAILFAKERQEAREVNVVVDHARPQRSIVLRPLARRNAGRYGHTLGNRPHGRRSKTRSGGRRSDARYRCGCTGRFRHFCTPSDVRGRFHAFGTLAHAHLARSFKGTNGPRAMLRGQRLNIGHHHAFLAWFGGLLWPIGKPSLLGSFLAQRQTGQRKGHDGHKGVGAKMFHGACYHNACAQVKMEPGTRLVCAQTPWIEPQRFLRAAPHADVLATPACGWCSRLGNTCEHVRAPGCAIQR